MRNRLVVLLLGAALLASGCRARAVPTWALLPKTGAEPPGYRSYTYVLLGSAKRHMPPDLLERQEARNRALIQTITGSSGAPAAQAPTLFCVPVVSGSSPGQPVLEQYDFELATSLRGLLAARFPGGHSGKLAAMRLLGDPGPFLVTTLQPAGKADGPFLYIELSHADPAQIAAAVAAFRKSSPDSGEPLLRHLAEVLKQGRIDAAVWRKN